VERGGVGSIEWGARRGRKGGKKRKAKIGAKGVVEATGRFTARGAGET